MHSPDPILALLHAVLRKPAARPLHTPLLSWTTVTVESSASAIPTLSLSCWLTPPDRNTPRLSLAMRIHPTGKIAIRTCHVLLHTMLMHAFEQNPATLTRCLASLKDLYPAMPPRAQWHISRPVPIDGRAPLPPASQIHTAAAAIEFPSGSTLRIELDRHADNRSPTQIPKPTAHLQSPCGQPVLHPPPSIQDLLHPPSKLAEWLLNAFPRARYRTLATAIADNDPSSQHALDSLCPLIELHHNRPDTD